MDVVVDLPSDAQAAVPVQQRNHAFHHPAVDAKPGAVFGAASGMCEVIYSTRTWLRYLVRS